MRNQFFYICIYITSNCANILDRFRLVLHNAEHLIIHQMKAYEMYDNIPPRLILPNSSIEVIDLNRSTEVINLVS